MRIVCTVTNDLTYDQRMNRICSSLAKANHDVELVGRKLPSSVPTEKKIFKQTRLKNFFNKKVFFYAEHNIRLFFYLMRVKTDVICSIDLDTILAGYLASKLRNKPLVYDAHEYFTEMEEIVARPTVHKAWLGIAKWILPTIKFGYTVSDGYAQLFKKNYGIDLSIVRNATIFNSKQLPTVREYILYQGAVNVGRGLEQLIKAMQQVDYPLVICGKGDVFDDLQKLVKELQLESKVTFAGYVKPADLPAYTAKAKVGITLFTNAGLSNQFSLANRFFDYMHHGVPQLAMAYPEYVNFNQNFEIASLVSEVSVDKISQALNQLISDDQYWNRLHQSALKASEIHNWQQDEQRLLVVYQEVEASLQSQ